MSRNKPPRKKYRPKPITAETMALARHHAAKPPPEDRKQILGVFKAAIDALCKGDGREHDWNVASGAVSTAQAVEAQRIVKGLAAELAQAEQVLQAIYDRCRLGPLWVRPTLTTAEQATLRDLYAMHSFQIEQLGRKEMIAALDLAEKTTLAEGNTATMATDLERLAA